MAAATEKECLKNAMKQLTDYSDLKQSENKFHGLMHGK